MPNRAAAHRASWSHLAALLSWASHGSHKRAWRRRRLRVFRLLQQLFNILYMRKLSQSIVRFGNYFLIWTNGWNVWSARETGCGLHQQLPGSVAFWRCLSSLKQNLGLQAELQEVLMKDVISTVPSGKENTGFYSWYFLVSKNTGRPTLDLSYFNKTIAKKSFHMFVTSQMLQAAHSWVLSVTFYALQRTGQSLCSQKLSHWLCKAILQTPDVLTLHKGDFFFICFA